MAETTQYDLELPGCTPEPLMAYLKALGILRLASEQKDQDARGWWKNDVFWLRSAVLFGDAQTDDAKRDALVKFFVEEYKPTPIVVPWSGGDFFGVDWRAQPGKFSKTPTSSKAIEAILATQTDRLATYQRGLWACKAALDKCAIDTKEKLKNRKWAFIQELRSSCDQPLLIEWIDAAAVGTVEKFAALLGSGGGSDGNTHFSDNFIRNLWDVLPDFDDQRRSGRDQQKHTTIEIGRELLNDSLFSAGTNRLIEKRTSSLYDSGAVGGPNATQGMERESLSNPWNVILALEGTVSFAGAATKRLATNAANGGAFPFQVSASVTVQDRLADKERAGTEVWLPHWARPARSDEVLSLLREGRAQCGSRPANSAVDMARAIASLGVDRGVFAFGRYAILKGRVGGENYNTAASLGRFHVVERAGVDLLREVDPWLDAFRRAASDKNAPPRFASALRRIDSALFDFCKYGGPSFFQRISIALGAAERELANAERFRESEKLKPLAGLSADWIEAADDDSAEFVIGRSLITIHDSEGKIGPLRANLEPVTVWYDKQQENKQKANWAEKDRAVVWNAADLSTNLANVLARRVMDGARAGCERLPLASRHAAQLDAIAAFIAGDLDDDRIERLIWGLMLIDGRSDPSREHRSPSRDRLGTGSLLAKAERRNAGDAAHALPRAYALLKLLFLPLPLVIDRGINGEINARLLRDDKEGGVVIRPEPSILHLLRGRGIGEACKIAMRRLRSSGLDPAPKPIRGRRVRDNDWLELDRMGDAGIDRSRLAASLVIPIDDSAVNRLARLVIRGADVEDKDEQTVAVSAEGESE